MTTMQQKKSHKDKILEELIILRDSLGMKQVEICRRLGYANDVFSKIKSGFSNGSPQLLAGLELLKELTILKRSGMRTNPELLSEIELMRKQLERMQRQISPHYGEHVPQNLTLNELPGGGAANSGDIDPVDALADELRAEREKRERDGGGKSP